MMRTKMIGPLATSVAVTLIAGSLIWLAWSLAAPVAGLGTEPTEMWGTILEDQIRVESYQSADGEWITAIPGAIEPPQLLTPTRFRVGG